MIWRTYRRSPLTIFRRKTAEEFLHVKVISQEGPGRRDDCANPRINTNIDVDSFQTTIMLRNRRRHFFLFPNLSAARSICPQIPARLCMNISLHACSTCVHSFIFHLSALLTWWLIFKNRSRLAARNCQAIQFSLFQSEPRDRAWYHRTVRRGHKNSLRPEAGGSRQGARRAEEAHNLGVLRDRRDPGL
jgi:hypothetical protein